MLEISSLDDIAALRENFEVECKLAAGKDGNGELPKDFWETYSAFANSEGGDVLLGLEEKKDNFILVGIKNVTKVIDDLWNLVNNPQKTSVNVLKPENVKELNIEGNILIHIHIPRATRKQRPVYISGNPISGTFKRQNSGDYRCTKESVRRMLAEQVDDSRDNEILFGFNLDDISLDSLNEYRQLYISLQPDHIWNTLEVQPFLRNIGGWRMDRESGRVGLTRAGLLMFGQLPSIQEAFPNYILDYQERPAASVEARWIDRLTLDGNWSGNLFDFYRRVIKKLTSDLKVPFSLDGDIRQDNTPVHQALREALINTLVHADFSGRASILVVKRPDMFGFRNPGLMRVPHEIAVQGGDSDCRNRLIHQMFRYIGLGEQAGSGIPKIYHGWGSQHWRTPLLYEKESPSDQTLLELRMLDLLPEGAIESLQEMFGDEFECLDHLERLILATAVTEQVVTHSRMVEITTEHAHDITLAFQSLCKKGLLNTSGHGRGTVYYLPGQRVPTADQAFGESIISSSRAMSGAEYGSSGHSITSSRQLSPSSGHSKESTSNQSNRTETGGLIVDGLALPLIDKLAELDDTFKEVLLKKSSHVRIKSRIPKIDMEKAILNLCEEYYLTLPVLCELLNRQPDPLRKSHLKRLIEKGKLTLAFPRTPTDPRQAYTATKEIKND